MKRIFWFSTTVHFAIVEGKLCKTKVWEHDKHILLVRKKAQKTACKVTQRETTRTIYLDVCAVVGTNYISALWDQNQTGIKTNKNSSKSQGSSKEECRKSWGQAWHS